jgi:hypothetical protein
MCLFGGNLQAEYQTFRQRITSVGQANDVKVIYERLYGDLSILDTKVSALLQLASIQAAVYSLIISPSVGETSPLAGWTTAFNLSDWPKSSLFFGAVATFLSAFACLSIIWVRWASSDDLEQQACRILQARNSRTVRYRLAWCMAALGLMLLLLHLYSANL